jgi:Sulfotransferase family
MKSLVFICGALRSGSTMVHLMLNHHPSIDNPGEFDFLFDQVGDDGSFPRREEFHEWLEIERIFNSHHLKIDPALEVRELIRSFVAQLQKADKVLALNIHRNFHRVPYVFPEAEYIHLIRDPRDVARSSIGMGWAGNVYYGVDHWVATEESWKVLRQQLQSEPHTLRYENLVRDYPAELRSLCAYLEIPYSDEMLSYDRDSTYSAPDISLIEQWKRNQTHDEINEVESKAVDLMVAAGYACAGDPAFSLSSWRKIQLKLGNLVYRHSFAIKRFGLRLYVLEKIGRYLKLETLQKQTSLAFAEIEKQYLK